MDLAQGGDRFIANRSSMDFDMARYLLVDGPKERQREKMASPSKEAYRKRLVDVLLMNRTRILSFGSRPSRPSNGVLQEFSRTGSAPVYRPRYISKSPERTLDASGILNDFNVNLLDWSSNNVIAIALGDGVCLWDASTRSSSDFMQADEEDGPVTSISWDPRGQHIAVGLNNSVVELWDATTNQKLRTLQGGHRGRVSSLSWNDQVLTTGGIDSKIINNDMRIRDHRIQMYRGHREEVCGLQWSGSGQQLASGGNDSLLYIWDRSMAASNSQRQWLHKFRNHTSVVKALAWCPQKKNLLAFGGSECIKFWNTQTGVCLNSVDTRSRVCSLLWSRSGNELLSSHGPPKNQLTLWKYPSMVKIRELTGHTSSVLFMAQSPDGCIVASASSDETLRFWNVFQTPKVSNSTSKTTDAEPFINITNHIR